MVCFRCGQQGHLASCCKDIFKLIQDGLVECNHYGKVQWKNGTSIIQEGDETLVEAIQRGAKKANLVMVAHTEMIEDPRYTYLNTTWYESDADSDEQADLWMDSISSDVLEPESYRVQRMERVSWGSGGGGPRESNLQVKSDHPDHATRWNDLEKVGMSKQAINQDVSRNVAGTRDRGGVKIPINVHQDVFDAKSDSDLVPMVVDEVRGHNKREQERKQVTSRQDGGPREVRKFGVHTETPNKIVKEIMVKQLAIEVGTLLEIAPGVKQGLVVVT